MIKLSSRIKEVKTGVMNYCSFFTVFINSRKIVCILENNATLQFV